jgi:enoyl-CoA hydratase/carnithine racemase
MPLKRNGRRTNETARHPRPRRTGAAAGLVRIERGADRVIAVLDAPGGNRLSRAMADTLMALAEEVEDDDSVRLMAVGGAGAAFCTGFDRDVDPRVVASLAAISKPTLALINGDALDEGLELAMALDLRVARSRARLGLRQVLRGELPCFGGTQRLARLAGASQALRMLLTGAVVDGAQALDIGLVTYAGRTRRECDALGRSVMAALASRAPIAARLVKEAIIKGSDMTVEQGIRLEEDLYALLQTTADRAEGIRAFLDKRKPLFKGT